MTQFPETGEPLGEPSSGMAIAAMVLGIIALVLFCVWYISIPCAIISIVLGNISRGKSRLGESGGAEMAKAGIICSIIALAIDALLIALAIVGLTIFGSKIHSFQQDQLQHMQHMPQMQQTAPGTSPTGG